MVQLAGREEHREIYAAFHARNSKAECKAKSQECVGLGATQRMKGIIFRSRQDRQKGRQVGRTKRSRSTQQTSRLKRHPGTKRTRSWTKRAPDESYLFLF